MPVKIQRGFLSYFHSFLLSFIPSVRLSPSLLSPALLSHPCYFKVFVIHIRNASKSCLMVAALVKYNILPSSVITEASGVHNTHTQSETVTYCIYTLIFQSHESSRVPQ
jgi:hypothetical protein